MFVVQTFICVIVLLIITDASVIKDRFEVERETRNTQLCLFGLPATGGQGGSTFSDWMPFVTSERSQIRKFTIRYGSEVDCFGLIYGNTDGGCHGGSGGQLHTIALAHDEYITEINGRGGTKVNMLKIVTNKKEYGPYGGSGGNPFTVNFAGKRLAFISGRKGSRLDNLYLHFYC